MKQSFDEGKISLQEINKFSKLYLENKEVCRKYCNHLELHAFSQGQAKTVGTKQSFKAKTAQNS